MMTSRLPMPLLTPGVRSRTLTMRLTTFCPPMTCAWPGARVVVPFCSVISFPFLWCWEQLGRERRRQPPLVTVGGPPPAGDEQAVDLGRRQRVNDVGGLPLAEAGPQRAAGGQGPRDVRLALLPRPGIGGEQVGRLRVAARGGHEDGVHLHPPGE